MPSTAHRNWSDGSPQKTYKTRANAIKAVEDCYGPNHPHHGSATLNYIVAVGEDGRYFPVFIGRDAITHGVHFHFCVAS